MEKLLLSKKKLIFAQIVEGENRFVVSPLKRPKKFTGHGILWSISEEESKCFETNGDYYFCEEEDSISVTFEKDYTCREFSGCPNCDFCGNAFEFSVGGDKSFQNAVSKFYWKSLLPECAEKSLVQKRRKWKDGYVLSTLKLSKYAGTYPAVDHEFHIRGRMAIGGEAERSTIKRMMLLQIRTMKADYSGRNRIPCSVQPNGIREYHVTRRSLDRSVKARMFPLTGIIELCGEVYNYYCLTKDKKFIEENIIYIEKGLEYLEKRTDKSGRLWSDVYYEDQVMKSGAAAQAQAFAANSLYLMSRLETLLGRKDKAEHYSGLSKRLKENYIQPVPLGYWNSETKSYADWIDKSGKAHDHIHLLSNALSVTYGMNDEKRNEEVNSLIRANDNIFQKFPSFVAAKIEDYTDSEIGSGGPYDLCAAGRYWCHDAKYRRATGDGETIKKQLEAVYNQAVADNFEMGERYDMNHVYYNSGKDALKNWHGSPLYYEYPNVFADVLVHDYFGLLPDEEADLLISPCCNENFRISMESFGVCCEYKNRTFAVTNISKENRDLKIDLSRLVGKSLKKRVNLSAGESLNLDL